jgi:hypothetical protein
VGTGRNLAVDRIRRDRTLAAKTRLLQVPEPAEDNMDATTFPDERLELVFTCCHPALATDAQVALTLRTLGGMSTGDIARAFLVRDVRRPAVGRAAGAAGRAGRPGSQRHRGEVGLGPQGRPGEAKERSRNPHGPSREGPPPPSGRTAARGKRGGLFFGRGKDQPFSNQAISQRANRIWKEAGLQRIGLHDCRHTFASLMIAAGVNAKALSTFMGHSSITITLDRYGHLFPGSEEEAAGLLDAYLESATEAGSG